MPIFLVSVVSLLSLLFLVLLWRCLMLFFFCSVNGVAVVVVVTPTSTSTPPPNPTRCNKRVSKILVLMHAII